MFGKTRAEILSSILRRLQEDTPITDVNPGSIARTFAEVLSEEFYEFYNRLELASTMNFVSTATGIYLDMIGKLLNCTRLSGEDDESYRARIVNQVYVVQGANQTAIRLRALSVPGVRDVILQEYTQGTGSFTVYVITEDPSSPQEVLNAVEDEVNQAKAYGVYAEVKAPVLIPVELMVRLLFSNDVQDLERAAIRQSVSRNIKVYVDSLLPGDPLIVNELIQRIMDTSDKIQDCEIQVLKVNDVERFVSNVYTDIGERLILETIEVA